MTPTRVFVVASSPLVRAGLRSMLADGAAGASLEVVGDGAPGDYEAGAARSGAEVVLASEDALSGETGLTAPGGETRALVLLSEDESAALRLGSLSLPGWGVVSPEAPPEALAAAISAVANGLAILPHALSERLLEGLTRPWRAWRKLLDH